MEKKLAIVLGIIMVVFILMVVTRGKIWPILVLGCLGFVAYKNNRFF